MDTGNYGADRLGGSFGKNDRMDSETNHGKNHDGDDVSLSRGSDGRDRVTVSHNGSSKSYSLNDYVSRNNSAWGSQGLSPISQAATATRTTVTSLTGAKQTTLSGQPIEDPNNSLLSTNPDKYLEKTLGIPDIGYIDSDLSTKISPEQYSKRYNEIASEALGANAKKFGMNFAGEISAPTVAGTVAKAFGGTVGNLVGTLAGYATTNAGDIANNIGNRNLSEIDRSIADDVNRRATRAIENDRSFGKLAGNFLNNVGNGISAITAPTGTGFFVGQGISFLGKPFQQEAAQRAIANEFGDIGGLKQKYEQSLQARHQALLDDAKRRSLDGSNQGILSQMTARLKPTTIQQQTNKMQELYDKLPSLNNLWNNIYIS